MATEARVSQQAIEVLRQAEHPQVRLHQQAVEVLIAVAAESPPEEPPARPRAFAVIAG